MSTDFQEPLDLLLIEDNPGDQDLVDEYLAMAGMPYTLKCAPCINDAIHHLQVEDCDLVLLDLGLPDSSGLDSLKTVKQLKPELPIIVLTGLDDDIIGSDAVGQGAEDYLTKNRLDPQSLTRSIGYAIERNESKNQLYNLNQLLKATHAINQLIMRETDINKLVAQACHIIAEVKNSLITWIALGDCESPTQFASIVPSQPQYDPFIQKLQQGIWPPCKDIVLQSPEGMTTIQPNDKNSICRQCPLWQPNGPVSACNTLLLLHKSNTRLGLLGIALPHKEIISIQEQQLLHEVAHDISFAIYSIQAEQQRSILEQQLYQSQKLEALGRLAGGLAHDFNNLLTVINNYSVFILEQLEDSNPLRSDILEILDAGERATKLSRQLLAFCRKQVIQPEVININQIITDTEKMLKRLIGEDIELETNLDTNIKKTLADPGHMEQVLMNLAVNARDAMPTGGRISISTANTTITTEQQEQNPELQVGSFIKITFTDNGIGIDPHIVKLVFEPFFTTKEKDRGTGLGLSTVYGIVTQNNGFINVFSEKNHFTTFEIFLPVTDEDQTCTPVLLPQKNIIGTESILLVEDEKGVREATRRILTKAGYMVTVAQHAQEAMEIFQSHETHFDLLITDVIMPKISGKELQQQLQMVQPDLQAIFISGYTCNALETHGVTDQEINFIAKPFNAADLLQKIREVLEEKS